MKFKPWIVVAAIAFATPPAHAQDLPTDQLERHAETVRNDMLLRSTLRHSMSRQNARGANRPTAKQVATCAKKAQFRSQYGAANPKVQKLYDLCRRKGL